MKQLEMLDVFHCRKGFEASSSYCGNKAGFHYITGCIDCWKKFGSGSVLNTDFRILVGTRWIAVESFPNLNAVVYTSDLGTEIDSRAIAEAAQKAAA